MDKYEKRAYGDEASPTLEGDRCIRGIAVVFERDSRIFYEPQINKVIIEVIKRGAITDDLIANSDVKALLEHDKSRLLARSTNGSGSLKLSLSDNGLKYEFNAPNTASGNDAVEYVSRGDMRGSSFAYMCNEKEDVTYERAGKLADGRVIYKRFVHRIRKIGDVSIVTDPAFLDTSVSIRSAEDYLHIESPEKKVINFNIINKGIL